MYSPSSLPDRQPPARLAPFDSHLCKILMSCGLLQTSMSMCVFALVPPAGHSQKCVQVVWQQSLVIGLELKRIFSQSFTCLSSVRPHTCWIDCFAWPIYHKPFASLHPFSSFTALWSGFLGLCIAWRYALTCSTLCLCIGGRSSW